MHTLPIFIPSKCSLLLILAALASIAIADSAVDRFSNGRRLTETQPYSFPTARRPPLASGQVVGISFAVVLAAGLVLIVILAICVPGIRDMIGRTGVSHQHTMRTRAPQTARENSAAHSAKAPVNYSAGSKNSSVDSEELTAFNKKRKNRIDLSDSDDVESSLSIRNSGEASD